ncbi:MAG: Hpt domain-containing protein [Opitutae bacterium]|nr:Hpt domain-containing protein [Opitutae bacterium]
MTDGHTLNPAAIQALRDLSPDGGQEFFQELVAIYLADTPKHLAQLEDALNRQDAAVARRAAHTMKGSSGNFGAEELAKLAHEIEKACKSSNVAAATALLPEFRKQFATVVAALKQVAADG